MSERSENREPTTSLAAYLTPLREHRKVVLLVTLVTVAIGFLVAVAGPKSYTSTTSVLIYPVSAGPTEALQATDRSDDMATEQQIADSRAVAEVAATELGELGIQVSPADAAAHIEVTNPEDSRILDVSYRASDPAIARVGSELATSAYLAYRSELNAASRQVARDSINNDIAVLQDRLTDVENRIELTAAGSSARLVVEVEKTSIEGELAAQQRALADLSTLSIDAATVFDAAREPSSPDGPGLAQLLTGAVAGGLVLGVIAAWTLATLGIEVPRERTPASSTAPTPDRPARAEKLGRRFRRSDRDDDPDDADSPFDDSDNRDPLELLKALDAIEADPRIGAAIADSMRGAEVDDSEGESVEDEAVDGGPSFAELYPNDFFDADGDAVAVIDGLGADDGADVGPVVEHDAAHHDTAEHDQADHATAHHDTAEQDQAEHDQADHATAEHDQADHDTAHHDTAEHEAESDVLDSLMDPGHDVPVAEAADGPFAVPSEAAGDPSALPTEAPVGFPAETADDPWAIPAEVSGMDIASGVETAFAVDADAGFEPETGPQDDPDTGFGADVDHEGEAIGGEATGGGITGAEVESVATEFADVTQLTDGETTGDTPPPPAALRGLASLAGLPGLDRLPPLEAPLTATPDGPEDQVDAELTEHLTDDATEHDAVAAPATTADLPADGPFADHPIGHTMVAETGIAGIAGVTGTTEVPEIAGVPEPSGITEVEITVSAGPADGDDKADPSISSGDPRELAPGPPSWDGPFVGPTTWEQLSAMAAEANRPNEAASVAEVSPDVAPETGTEVDPTPAEVELVAGNDVDALFERLGQLGSSGPVTVLSLSDRNPAAGLTAGFELADELRAVGAHVLLIDARIDDPILDTLFEDGPGSGLAQVMTGEVVLDQAVRSLSGLDGLDLLTVGTLQAETGGHLTGAAFPRLLAEARLNYHSIVIIGEAVTAAGPEATVDVERARALAATVDGLIVGTADPVGTPASADLAAVLASFDAPVLQLITAPVPAPDQAVQSTSSV